MKRAFYHYTEWEDFKSGMYEPPNKSSSEESENRIHKAVELLSSPSLCRQYMEKVVTDWKITTEQNLTNLEQNRKAWLGWCACFLYGGCHDEETRAAWGLMTEESRVQANKIASQVIREWERRYTKQFPDYQFSIFD